MTYKIILKTYDQEQTGEAIISKALGFERELSNEALMFFFQAQINGVFKSKRKALKTADAINARGAFGGYPIKVTASVVKV